MGKREEEREEERKEVRQEGVYNRSVQVEKLVLGLCSYPPVYCVHFFPLQKRVLGVEIVQDGVLLEDRAD